MVLVGLQPISPGVCGLAVFTEPFQETLEAVPTRVGGSIREVIAFVGLGFPVGEVISFGGVSRVADGDSCGREVIAFEDT